MMDSAELDLIRSSMRHIVATATPFDFAATLSDNGWHDLLDDDPAVAIGLLGEEVGSQISPLPLLDLVLQHGLAGRIDATTAVLLPPMRRGSDATDAISAVVDGTELVANGMLLSGHERARSVWTASIAGVFAIDRSALTTMPLAPHDSELGLCASTGRVPVLLSIFKLFGFSRE